MLATSGVSRAHPVPVAAARIREDPTIENGLEAFWSNGHGLETFRQTRRSDANSPPEPRSAMRGAVGAPTPLRG